MDQIFIGHGRVNHSETFVEPPPGDEPMWMPAGFFNPECLDHTFIGPAPQGLEPFRIHTQNCERSWRGLKQVCRTSNMLQYVPDYIGEWMYRKNILERIPTVGERFQRFLTDVGRAYPGLGRVAMDADILNCHCHECDP